MQTIQFLLVPDSGAARKVRRCVAEQGARSGILVGTWLELIEHAKNAYVIEAGARDWEENFQAALGKQINAFWFESYTVSPQDTASAVRDLLLQLVSGADFDFQSAFDNIDALSVRPKKIVKDLLQLLTTLEGKLPNELTVIRQLFESDGADTIRKIQVYHVDDLPQLSRWQSSLVKKINSYAGAEEDKSLRALLNDALLATPNNSSETSLSVLQSDLYLTPKNKKALDESLQWVAARDFWEEAEVACGMAQSILNSDSTLTPADIGLLVPDSFEYSIAIKDAFSLSGLPLSGLPVDYWKSDLGREALFYFLCCRQKPAPAMGLAVCMSSPLMPWTREEGAKLAQDVMGGSYKLRPFYSASDKAKRMLDLIREGDDKPENLIAAIGEFVSLLDKGGKESEEKEGKEEEGKEPFQEHAYQAQELAGRLIALLEPMQTVDWVSLRKESNPKKLAVGNSPNFNLEGITVCRAGRECWRPVRFLIVMGFTSGSYPVASKTSPIFSEDELISIRDQLGLQLNTLSDELAKHRARFKRQLSSVSDAITFLIPRKDSSGATQAPSESLIFMHQLFKHSADTQDEAEDLILELDASEDREQVRFLSVSNENTPTPPRDIVATDIQFDCDLLALRKDKKGNVRPESPSSLDTLMVSRLAWLLRRLNAEPLGWEPERPNVMLLGTLAHYVFEMLFQRGIPLPSEEEINSKVELYLDEAIKQSGPFLRAAQWQVERKHLATGITEAALAWRSILEKLDAEIVGSEEWLEGEFNVVSIHGQADLLLGLSDGRLLIVDYKRSSAAGRRPRMEKGYDSQASLYRTMLETGGPKDKENTELLERLKNASRKGIVYFMLNDQTALTDTRLTESGQIPGWEVLDEDVSGHAIDLIKQRLKEVQAGLLVLNREDDAEFFDKKAGVKPYALESGPLIPLFTVAGETEGAQ